MTKSNFLKECNELGFDVEVNNDNNAVNIMLDDNVFIQIPNRAHVTMLGDFGIIYMSDLIKLLHDSKKLAELQNKI